MRRAVSLFATTLVLAALAHVACGSDDASNVAPAVDASADAIADVAIEARTQKLAASGAQFFVKNGAGIELRPANLVADADLVAVHQDFYGIPWDAFEAGSDPP